jgi:hypothetical protein
LRAYNKWCGEQRRAGTSPMVDATLSRSVLADLHTAGVDLNSAARWTGLKRDTLLAIRHGRTTKVRARTQELILALAEQVVMPRS